MFEIIDSGGDGDSDDVKRQSWELELQLLSLKPAASFEAYGIPLVALVSRPCS
jgi:hypothetical protein